LEENWGNGMGVEQIREMRINQASTKPRKTEICIYICTAEEKEGIRSKCSAKSLFKMAPEERSLSSGEEGEEEEEVGRARKTTGTLPPSVLPQPYSSTDSVDGGGISSTDTYFTVCNCT
jgi:hypothetical protein